MFTGLWLVQTLPPPEAEAEATDPKPPFLFQALVTDDCFLWPIDRASWSIDHLHDNASQISRRKVPPLSSVDVRGDRRVRYRAADPRPESVRCVADDEKG